MKVLMERLRLFKWKGKRHKEEVEVNREIDKGNFLKQDFKGDLIRCCGGQCKKEKNKWNEEIGGA
jgi:hypothetical protein